MKGRLKQLTGVFLALLLCVSLAAPAAAANPSVNDIATAALELISSHEGTYNSVNANDSGAVSVGKIQWHGDRALEVVRLAANYMGANGAVAILGQSFYDEIMTASSWASRSVNETEAAALRQLLGSEAGHRAEDEIGARDLSRYVNDGMSRGLSNPTTLVYYCDLMNQWPVKAMEIARSTVASYGANASVDAIHAVAMDSAMGTGQYNEMLRIRAYNYCINIRWDGYGFSDVPQGSWYAAPVDWAVDKKITFGTSSTTFSPDAVCTRAQAVTFLWRAMGALKPTTTVQVFSDVSASDYYYDAVIWAAEQGITSGTGNGTFSPDKECSRGEIVTFLWRAKNMPAPGGSNFFWDVGADSYCAPAVDWAYCQGITEGNGGGMFSPNDACTRAHIVTFLYRDQT